MPNQAEGRTVADGKGHCTQTLFIRWDDRERGRWLMVKCKSYTSQDWNRWNVGHYRPRFKSFVIIGLIINRSNSNRSRIVNTSLLSAIVIRYDCSTLARAFSQIKLRFIRLAINFKKMAFLLNCSKIKDEPRFVLKLSKREIWWFQFLDCRLSAFEVAKETWINFNTAFAKLIRIVNFATKGLAVAISL